MKITSEEQNMSIGNILLIRSIVDPDSGWLLNIFSRALLDAGAYSKLNFICLHRKHPARAR